ETGSGRNRRTSRRHLIKSAKRIINRSSNLGWELFISRSYLVARRTVQPLYILPQSYVQYIRSQIKAAKKCTTNWAKIDSRCTAQRAESFYWIRAARISCRKRADQVLTQR